MSKRLALFVVVAVAVMAAACANPPQAQIDAAQTAITDASTAGAEEYAPEALATAKDAAAKLDAELRAQEGKFALTRSYEEATKLANAAAEAGKNAATQAAANKQAAQAGATTAITDAKAAIQEAETALSGAPKGKGSKADIEALQADLAAATTSVADAETAMNGQHYNDAKAKADAAKDKAGSVKAAVEEAIALRKGGRRQ